MNPRDALRHADPARHLPSRELDRRDEALLRELLSLPADHVSQTVHPTPASARSSRTARDWKPLIATGVVAVAVAVSATLAIRAVPARNAAAPATTANPTSNTDSVLEDAVFVRLSTVLTGDVPIRQKSAMTWTDQQPGSTGGAIDLDGRTLYVAAACDGGGSIAIQITGHPDETLACDTLSTVGPINLTALVGEQSAGLNVVATSGTPHYIAKAMAFAPK